MTSATLTSAPAPTAITTVLCDEDCWHLLEATGLGRLAVMTERGADVFPVNYVVHDESVVFRSAPGQKLVDLVAEPRVAFEIDGGDEMTRWSVVLRGVARRLDHDAEIDETGIRALETATAVPKHNYVRITPTRLTGRRVRRP